MSSFLPKLPFSQNGHIGISVDATTVRAVLVNGDGGVLAKAEHRFEQPVISTNSVSVDGLALGFQELIKQVGYTGRFAALVIPEKFAFSRQHTLPNVSTSEISEAVQWQIESIFPFPKSEIYTDWKLLSQDSKQSTLLLVAIPRSLLNQLKNACEAAGLSPISFQPSAASLIHLIPKNEKNLIIVELSEQGTSSTLIQNGVSSLTTTTYFSDQSPPEQVFEDLKQAIKSIMVKLKEGDEKQVELSKLYITGEKASAQVAQLLSREFQVEGQILPVNEVPPAFHVTYAAAHSHIHSPQSEKSINLLPSGLTQLYYANHHHELVRSAIKISAALISVAVLASLGVFIFTLLTLNQIKSPPTQAPPPGQGQQITPAQVQKAAQRYNSLFALKRTPEQSIVTLVNQLPGEISITSLNYEAQTKKFTLTGTANNRQTLLNLKQKLESTDLFSHITLPLSSLESAETIDFSMEITEKKAS